MATVLLFGGLHFQDASAKTVKKSRSSRNTQMKVPDFAFPQTVEKNASANLKSAVAHGDWATAIEATIQMVTAENLISQDNATAGISKIDSISAIAPASWRPAFQLIKAGIYSSIYGSIRWKADSRKLDVDSIPAAPYEWSRDIFADKVFGLCSEILDDTSNDTRPLKEWGKFIENSTDAYALGMTVGEFLSLRCFSILGNYADPTRDVIPFFNTSSAPATPGGKCALLRDKAIDRLIKSTSDRGQALLLAQALSEKANVLPYSLRMKSLIDAYNEVKGTEGEQLILSNLRDFLNE